MNKIIIFSLVSISLFLLGNCAKNKSCSDDELTLTKNAFTGNQLKLDGVYFEIIPDKPQEYTSLYFFYENGVVLGSSGYDFNAAASGNIDIESINRALKSKAAWGLFEISGNTIHIERWTPSASGCFKTLFEIGEIQNDTTFVITRMEYRDNGNVEKVSAVNNKFHFIPLTEKPDSTNNYIK